jgi:thiol-disulfide isomerase/thioredoxin
MPKLLWIIALITLCVACTPEDEPDALPMRTMTTCGAQTELECDESAERWPDWVLEDVQPQSASFGQTYGLEAFKGKPVFVAFLVGWCGYCRAQALELEALRTDPMFSDMVFVIVHGASANTDADRSALLEVEEGVPRHGMIMFQDTDQVNAWGQHGGSKDDFYIYNAQGILSSYLEGGSMTNLATEPGKQLVRDALLAAKK